MAEATGNGWWPGGPQSEEAEEFLMKHGEHLDAIASAIGTAFAEHDGNTLVLMQASLKALMDNIVAGLSKTEIKIEED